MLISNPVPAPSLDQEAGEKALPPPPETNQEAGKKPLPPPPARSALMRKIDSEEGTDSNPVPAPSLDQEAGEKPRKSRPPPPETNQERKIDSEEGTDSALNVLELTRKLENVEDAQDDVILDILRWNLPTSMLHT